MNRSTEYHQIGIAMKDVTAHDKASSRSLNASYDVPYHFEGS